MTRNDWVSLWLTECTNGMAKKAEIMERCFDLLQNKETEYGRAHRLVAEGYRKAEACFATLLSAETESGK